MSDFDLVKAAIDRIRADGTLNAAVGGRIYSTAQVPPDASFPRCYIGKRKGRGRVTQANMADGAVDKLLILDVMFVTTTAVTPQAFLAIEGWADAAKVLLDYWSPPIANVAYLRYFDDIDPYPDSDMRNSYVTGGYGFEALRQFN